MPSGADRRQKVLRSDFPPVLTLEQVYGALTFYLVNKSEIDAYLKTAEAGFEAMRRTMREQAPMFYQKLTGIR
jgi:hypothetical protein